MTTSQGSWWQMPQERASKRSICRHAPEWWAGQQGKMSRWPSNGLLGKGRAPARVQGAGPASRSAQHGEGGHSENGAETLDARLCSRPEAAATPLQMPLGSREVPEVLRRDVLAGDGHDDAKSRGGSLGGVGCLGTGQVGQGCGTWASTQPPVVQGSRQGSKDPEHGAWFGAEGLEGGKTLPLNSWVSLGRKGSLHTCFLFCRMGTTAPHLPARSQVAQSRGLRRWETGSALPLRSALQPVLRLRPSISVLST